MTLSAFLLAAIAVIPADRLAMADRLFNRGEYAAARVEYAALSGEKSIPADEVIYRLAECDRALGKSAEARRGYGELLEKFPTSPRADRSRLMRALNWRWEGPLGTPLGLAHWKRASSPVEAGTAGYL